MSLPDRAPDPGSDPVDAAAGDEELLAGLFDQFLETIQDGRSLDPNLALPDRPDLRARVRETYRMAMSISGRRDGPPPVLDGYEVLHELGRGGMGRVYLARHDQLGRLVALKVLPAALGLSSRAEDRFLAEARALAQVRHPHIVRIHNILRRDELLAYEMEWVDGPSLRRLIDELRKRPRSTIADVCEIVGATPEQLGARSVIEYLVRMGVNLARALHAVHEAGLLHRDVKPSNVLIRKDGTALLADFGLVRGTDSEHTRTGAFLGTLNYAPPEQLQGDDVMIDRRADVYALGATLFEAIAREMPFAGRTTVEVLRRIEAGQRARLRRLAPDAPRDLEVILEHALELEPADRYQTAEEFADDLERLLHLQPIRARPQGPIKRLNRAIRRNRRPVTAALVAALVVAAVLVPAILSRGGPTAESHQESQRLLQQARSRMMPPVDSIRRWINFAGSPMRRVQERTMRIPLEDLRAAEDEYRRAIALEPDDPTVRRELTIVTVVADASDVRRLGATPMPLEGLPPLTARALQVFVDGGELTIDPADIAAADDEDQRLLGLVCFLTGDLQTCVVAWMHLDPLRTDQPMVHAALGSIFLADGDPERAYPLLFHANSVLPESSRLNSELAEAALELGDHELARRWLDHSPAEPGSASAYSRRVLADLAWANGDLDIARELYSQLAGEKSGIARLRLAQLLWAQDDPGAAAAALEALVRDAPDSARYRLELARIAVATGDLPRYMAQARWAYERRFEYARSRGALRDTLEILHVGGLRSLHDEATRRSHAPVDPRRTWSAPIALRAPFASLDQVESWIRRWSGFEAEARDVMVPVGTGDLRGALFATSVSARLLVWFPELAGQFDPVCGGMLLGAATYLRSNWSELVDQQLSKHLGGSVVDARTTNQWFEVRGDVEGDMFAVPGRVGDVDGDGCDDVLVGTNGSAARSIGYVRMFSGRSGQLLYEIHGDRPGEMFGSAVAGLGDVDGDGCPDFAVGAPGAGETLELAGAVRVFSGADGALLYSIPGTTEGRYFGSVLAAAGDLDHDGIGDFLAAAPGPPTGIGEVLVLSGTDGATIHRLVGERSSMFGAALSGGRDTDGDGVPDIAVGAFASAELRGAAHVFSGADGSPLFQIQGSEQQLLGMAVSLLDDVDGDGLADLVVGAGLPGEVSVHSPARHTMLVKFHHQDPLFGNAVAAADLDGDGEIELIVGSPRASQRGPHSGAVYVYRLAADPALSSPDPILTFLGRRARDEFGGILTVIGDVDGDGRPELGLGAPGAGASAGAGRHLAVGEVSVVTAARRE